MTKYSFLQKSLLLTTFVSTSLFVAFSISLIANEHGSTPGTVLGISVSDYVIKAYDTDFNQVSTNKLKDNEIIDSSNLIKQIELKNGSKIISYSSIYDLSKDEDLTVYSGYAFVKAEQEMEIFMLNNKVTIFPKSSVLVDANTYEVMVFEGSVIDSEGLVIEKDQSLKWLVDTFGLRTIDYDVLANSLETKTIVDFLYTINLVPESLQSLTPFEVIESL